MGKVIVDRKDDKFIVSIIPYVENTFVIDDIEITEEARYALFNKEGNISPAKKFTEEWREKIFRDF